MRAAGFDFDSMRLSPENRALSETFTLFGALRSECKLIVVSRLCIDVVVGPETGDQRPEI